MPKSVVTAIVAAFLLGAVDFWVGVALVNTPSIATFASVVVPVVLGIVAIGLVLRHRLAWQWGRVMGGLNVLRTILVTGSVIAAGESKTILISAVPIGIASAIMAVALSTRSARNYFRLTCPECGTEKAGAADFFFNRAKCGRCGAKW